MRCGRRSARRVASEDATHLGVNIGDFLNRAALARPTMPSGDDTAIGALAKLLDKLVFGVDDKGRVEGGEAVALHGYEKYGPRWRG